VFQTSDSFTVNDQDSFLIEELSQRSHSGGLTPRTKQEDSGQEPLRTNIQKYCIRRRPESGTMPQGTAQHWTITVYYSVIQCMYTYTEAIVLSTRLTSCKRCPQKTYLSEVNFVVVTNFYCTVYFCKDLCCLCFYIVLTFGVIHKSERTDVVLLANVRYMSSSVRLSSVTFLHATQAIEIFRNVSTPYGTLAIRDFCTKILRRSSQVNPFAGG